MDVVQHGIAKKRYAVVKAAEATGHCFDGSGLSHDDPLPMRRAADLIDALVRA